MLLGSLSSFSLSEDFVLQTPFEENFSARNSLSLKPIFCQFSREHPPFLAIIFVEGVTVRIRYLMLTAIN